MATRGASLTVDSDGLIPLLRGLGRVEKSLRDESNGRLRDAAGNGAAALIVTLRQSAGSSATPQAAIVAQTLRVRRDRLVSVAVGGRARVGSRGTAAGAILWGSERGGHNFDAPRGGNYWIRPAVEAFRQGPAERLYLEAVSGILRDAGIA